MKTFTLKNFELQCGAVLPEAEIVYETYGELAGDSFSAQSGVHEDLFSLDYQCAMWKLKYIKPYMFLTAYD